MSHGTKINEDLLDSDWATFPSSAEACWEVLRKLLVGYQLIKPDASKDHVIQTVEQILSACGLTWQSFGKEQLARMRSKTEASVEGQCVYYRGFDMKSHWNVLALPEFCSEHWTIKRKQKRSVKSSVASIYKRRMSKMDLKRRYIAKYRIKDVRYWGSTKNSSVERHRKDINLGQDAGPWAFASTFLKESKNLQRLNDAAKQLAEQANEPSPKPLDALPDCQHGLVADCSSLTEKQMQFVEWLTVRAKGGHLQQGSWNAVPGGLAPNVSFVLAHKQPVLTATQCDDIGALLRQHQSDELRKALTTIARSCFPTGSEAQQLQISGIQVSEKGQIVVPSRKEENMALTPSWLRPRQFKLPMS